MPIETYRLILATRKYKLEPEGVDKNMSDVDEKKIVKRKIMFVCTGNTCRSPMAEYILKDILKKNKLSKYYQVTSAGLMASEGSPISPLSLEALKELGINGGAKHKSKQFFASMIPKKDLIITMTSAHKVVIGNYFNVFSIDELTSCRDISDPFGGSIISYTRVAEQLADAVQILFDKVINLD